MKIVIKGKLKYDKELDTYYILQGTVHISVDAELGPFDGKRVCFTVEEMKK